MSNRTHSLRTASHRLRTTCCATPGQRSVGASGTRTSGTRTRGFTLVELIVALAIAAIFMALSISILSTAMNVSAKVTTDAEQGKVTDLVLDFCEERLLYARQYGVYAMPKASDTRAETALQQLLSEHPGQGILYIGNADGLPDTQGYVYYRQADAANADEPVNVFGAGFYQDGLVQLGLSRSYYDENTPWVMVLDPTTAGFLNTNDKKPSETVTITFYDRQGARAATSTRSVLLVNAEAQPDYVTDGLIARYDAVDNIGGGDMTHSFQTTTWTDLSGNHNDLQLTFTGGTRNTHILERSIYFDGSGDYAFIRALDLSGLDTVTVEICYKQTGAATDTKVIGTGVLYEFASSQGANKGFGLVANWGKTKFATGYIYSYMGEGSAGGLREANYPASNKSDSLDSASKATSQAGSFVTHANVYSMSETAAASGGSGSVVGSALDSAPGSVAASRATSDTPRRVWVNGSAVNLLTSADPPTELPPELAPYRQSEYFSAQPFYVASSVAGNGSAAAAGSAASAPAFCGEIAAIRIYNRALTPEEAAQNAAQDALRFSGQ
ncbi:MAG: prepilin-type N-terminal cleavage/methylation domain-containing protein [Coriobacteriales bacterium]|jgi:prepilin-type N-terminal cleavage/methylation domain-containing protein|nr:prepilin-type N-terminal cleavage/methylation domain-containing protein [Coriobacteriales bacterium]